MRNIGGDARKEGVMTPEGRKRYRDNYDNIKGFGGPKGKPGTYHQVEGGDLVHEDDLTKEQLLQVIGRTRSMDTADIASEAMGCSPDQVKEFNQNLVKAGISNAQYDPGGTLHMKGRDTKFKVMKSRGFHDRDEVRG